MPKIYKCEKCNKYFNKKDHLITHINRKFPCVNPNNISCYTIKDAVEINEDLPSYFNDVKTEKMPFKPPKKDLTFINEVTEIKDVTLLPNNAEETQIITDNALEPPKNPDIAEKVTEKIPILENKKKLTIGDAYDANKVDINVENLDPNEMLKTEPITELKTELKTEPLLSVAKDTKTELETELETELKTELETELKTELKKTELETELKKTEQKKANSNVYGSGLNEINTKIKRRLFSKKDIDDVLQVTKYNNNKTDITITDTPFVLDNICDITPPIPPKPLQTKSVFINDGNDAINFDEFTKSNMYMTDLVNIKKYGKKKSVKNYRPRHNLTPRTHLRNMKNKIKEPLSVAETRPKTKKQNIMNITKL